MLLVPPLLWFGAIYLGSLLNLWQGFYTFDDFTMAVTPDLTLANFAALFNPSNFDIILRTLSMAIVVSLASAVLAFPIAYYMARYTTGKTKAFFYIAVMMPMWASYIVKAYAWTLLLAKGGVAQWFVQHLHLEPVLQFVLGIPGVGGSTCRPRTWGASGVRLYLAAVHDPADPGRAGAPAAVAAASLGRPRRQAAADLHAGDPAAVGAGHRRRLDLHLLADPGRLHRAATGRPAGYFIGSMVYAQQGAIGNMPMAAAFTLVPIVLIAVYLSIVKRLGAFDAL
jgi:putative spermidine/putrescine transport system permease protein